MIIEYWRLVEICDTIKVNMLKEEKMGIRIGKTETGKLYHIVNIMNGGDNFGLCGCYLSQNSQFVVDEIYKLDNARQMCERCMYTRFYKQNRD